MTAYCLKTDETGVVQSDFFAPLGEPGSGYLRYAAAMHFYNQGLCSGELLEIYRRCCKFDGEDPIALAEHERIKPLYPEDFAKGT